MSQSTSRDFNLSAVASQPFPIALSAVASQPLPIALSVEDILASRDALLDEIYQLRKERDYWEETAHKFEGLARHFAGETDQKTGQTS